MVFALAADNAIVTFVETSGIDPGERATPRSGRG